MTTKNIAISEEAYRRLKSLKRPGESFTDVIERMTRRRGMLELAGILSKKDGDALEARVKDGRARSSRRLHDQMKELRRHDSRHNTPN